MQLIKFIDDMVALLASKRVGDTRIGFVPTMGALHNGHLALVKTCNDQTDLSVVSIFVNPTQFNDPSDLAKYPRTIENDLELLEGAGCDIVFLPTDKEIYPEPDNRIFDFNGLDQVMEGRFRPGHFNGVAQVVTRLFDIVRPHKAYFGEKDFQQLAIINHVVKTGHIPIDIVACPTVRESDGLAMSSRNMRLTSEQRQVAATLSQCLFYLREHHREFQSMKEISAFANNFLGRFPEIKSEYLEIVHPDTLMAVQSIIDLPGSVACMAAWIGNVRLIDNVRFFS